MLNIRCIFLQCSWNYRHFQGLGWCQVLLPELQRIYSGRRLQTAVDGYLKYFNTNTFFAPTLAAATIALERKLSNDGAVKVEPMLFSTAVMAPFAAVGDALFWGGLRPLVCCCGVVLALYGYWWAPLAMLVMFNIPTFIVRLSGAWFGFNRDAEVVDLIKRWHLADVAVWLKHVTVIAAGIICAVLIHKQSLTNVIEIVSALLLLPLLLVAVWGLRKGVPVAVVLLVIVGLMVMADTILII